MPSFSLSSQAESSKLHGEAYKSERIDLQKKVTQIITACDKTTNVSEFNINFLRILSGYLRMRENEIHLFSSDNHQVRVRSNFVQELLPLIQSNDIARQLHLLREENIRRFKGFFSQRLYDILVAHRTSLQQQEKLQADKKTVQFNPKFGS